MIIFYTFLLCSSYDISIWVFSTTAISYTSLPKCLDVFLIVFSSTTISYTFFLLSSYSVFLSLAYNSIARDKKSQFNVSRSTFCKKTHFCSIFTTAKMPIPAWSSLLQALLSYWCGALVRDLFKKRWIVGKIMITKSPMATFW